MIKVQIGPYEIQSEDAFLDSNDLAINSKTEIEVPLNEVASYIDMIHQQSDSKFANKWRASLSGNNPLLLTDAGEHINNVRKICCSTNLRPLIAVTGVNVKKCELKTSNTSIPVIISEKDSYPELFGNNSDDLVGLLGGKLSENGKDWKDHIGNCHAYALHEYLGIGPNTALDDTKGKGFYIEEIPNDDENVFFCSYPDNNGLEIALSNFFKPVALIKSNEIPLPPFLCENLIAYSTQEDTHEIESYLTEIDKLFQIKLGEMLNKGVLTEEKLKQRKYVFVMGYKLLTEPDFKTDHVLFAEHSAILLYDDDSKKFKLEAKMSFSVALQSFIISASASSSLFINSMMYRIYEPELSDTQSSFNLEDALKSQDGVLHPILFRRKKMSRSKAEMALDMIGEK